MWYLGWATNIELGCPSDGLFSTPDKVNCSWHSTVSFVVYDAFDDLKVRNFPRILQLWELIAWFFFLRIQAPKNYRQTVLTIYFDPDLLFYFVLKYYHCATVLSLLGSLRTHNSYRSYRAFGGLQSFGDVPSSGTLILSPPLPMIMPQSHRAGFKSPTHFGWDQSQPTIKRDKFGWALW